MCQILCVKEKEYASGKSNIIELLQDFKFLNYIVPSNLSINGKDANSYTIIQDRNYYTVPYMRDLKRTVKLLSKPVTAFVAFSRQTPEMEDTDVHLPPYYNKKQDSLYWVHGTIWNDKDLAEKYDAKITVDTEILSYVANYSELKGNFSFVQYRLDSNSFIFKNLGMGLWKYNVSDIMKEKKFCDLEIIATTPFLYTGQGDRVNGTLISDIGLLGRRHVYVAYSGGMDVTLSTIKHLASMEEIGEVHLVYFDYGTKASVQEKKSLQKMKSLLNYLKSSDEVYYRGDVETLVYDTTPMFSTFLESKNLRLVSGDADNIEKETEANLAYVPYRNTLFTILLKELMESRGHEGDILLGLNLTEGQVYGDNSAYWLTNMNEVLKVGGKQFDRNFRLIAPYIFKTKTNMLKEFVQQFGKDILLRALDVAYSCYYPTPSGEPCGKCGSCRLRDLAIQRVL